MTKSREAPRVLLFTGKGGVGKTTTAAATALRCADAGLRTIVLSTDPAHSLADAFDVRLTSVGSPITPMLWGQQLDAQERLEDAWGEIQGYLQEVLGWAGLDAVEAEELSVIPGLDEIFSLFAITDGSIDEIEQSRLVSFDQFLKSPLLAAEERGDDRRIVLLPESFSYRRPG